MAELWAIGLVLLGDFIGSFGSIYLKKASGMKFGKSFFTNPHLFLGILLYGIAIPPFIISLLVDDF
ncbi:hypothetical protein IH922_05995 [candidate division KSB1 bacterium]|nr:hypothetical protein [candidate division KSB1 bacterium]